MANYKPPAFQWYPKDWLSDEKIAAMTLEEKGAFFQLLNYMWLASKPCHLPSDPYTLARILFIDIDHWGDIERVVTKPFELVKDENGFEYYVHPRLRSEYSRLHGISLDREGAGRLGGLAKASKRLAKPKQTPSSSSSSSSSISSSIKKPPIPLKRGDAFYKDVMLKWNNAAPHLQKITRLSKTRKRQIDQRLKDPAFAESWVTAAERLGQSSFAKSSRWANFDWLFKNDNNYVKALEGNYDDRKQPPNATEGRLAAREGKYDNVGYIYVDPVKEEPPTPLSATS